MVLIQRNNEITLFYFYLFDVLVVEHTPHEGFLVMRIFDGPLIDGKDLSGWECYVVEV